jgi:anti-sigma-K factor RskA
MNNDDDIEGLAAEFVLGSLDCAERAEAVARRKTEPALHGAIAAWEARLAPLSDALPGIEPPGHVLRNVMRQVQGPPRVSTGSWSQWAADRWWAFAGGASAVAACVVAMLIWMFEAPVPIPAKFVSELQKTSYSADASTMALVPLGFEVYFDLQASTMLVRPYAVPPGSSRDYQLWLIPQVAAAPPISLGVISLAEPTTSPWPATYPPRELLEATLAVSLEPRGGSPKGIPTGPTMFAGKLVQATPYPFP